MAELVGEGGMGLVYRGERADGAFAMKVAIKLLKLRGSGLGEHLQRECRFLARLNHPGITRLLDAGLDQRAGPFVVMEWVDGQNLSDWAATKDPSTSARLDLFEQLVEAIAHAHQRLVVHGDIKPENIRIQTDGVVKLMDFGVGRLLDSSTAEFQVRALTPAFAAPEQLAGEEVTPQSDIWALGALLFWLLTEQTLPSDQNDIPQRLGQTGQVRARELAALIRKACAQDPEARYRAALELLEDIHRFSSHYPVSALPPNRPYLVGRFVRRNPVLVGGITTTLAALSIGLIATTVMYRDAERGWQAAETRQARADARASELQQVATFQEEQLGQIDPKLLGSVIRQSIVDKGKTQSEQTTDRKTGPVSDRHALDAALTGVNFTDVALEGLDRTFFDTTLAAIDQQFLHQPTVRARLLQTMATTLRELGRSSQAEAPQKKAFELRRESLGLVHPDTLTSIHELGAVNWQQQRYDESFEHISQALDLRQEHLGPTHPDTLTSLHGMGVLLMSMARYDEAEQTLQAAIKGRQDVLGARDLDTLNSVGNLGLLYIRRGQPAAGAPLIEQTLEGRREALGPRHPKTLSTLNDLGVALADLGEHEQAAAIHRQAATIRAEVYGSDHPQTLRSVSNLGFALQQAGAHGEAEQHHRQALAGRIRVLGERHSDSWLSMSHLGLTLSSLDHHDEAEKKLRRALIIAEQEFGPAHPGTIVSFNNLSNALMASDQTEQAERLSRDSVQLAKENMGTDNWMTGAVLVNHARALQAMEKFEDAARQAEAGFEILERILGDQHPRTLQSAELLAETYTMWYESSRNTQLKDQATFWRQQVNENE